MIVFSHTPINTENKNANFIISTDSFYWNHNLIIRYNIYGNEIYHNLENHIGYDELKNYVVIINTKNPNLPSTNIIFEKIRFSLFIHENK